MPDALAEKIRKAKDFNKGYHQTEVLASSLIDMQWHTLTPDAPPQDPDTIEAEALTKAGLKLPYARPATAPPTSPTSGEAVTPPATTPTSGPRPSKTAPSPGSNPTAA